MLQPPMILIPYRFSGYGASCLCKNGLEMPLPEEAETRRGYRVHGVIPKVEDSCSPPGDYTQWTQITSNLPTFRLVPPRNYSYYLFQEVQKLLSKSGERTFLSFF
ncbi:hypothetical protein GDO81_025575 [Engystomops pustulosus]|uniref:Uncharacterized protein n=1 Tax=Engystomops pustulosus TaxID=76066 RepID=A0AAV6ZG04_ENGPU|nr:hypothetical protein GDO81_025575 [Engystomops pustulosus]